jgi:diguanylate cyclase (GGDEF)-like protein
MRDFFRVHQEQPDVGLFISRPYASRNRESDPSVAFSRRRSSPDGKFQGIVVAALRLAYFQDMFTIFNLGANGMVALVDGMGRQLTRHPSLPLRTGIDITTTMIGLAVQKKTTGFIIEKSPFDNVMRIVVFRKIGNYPLFVIVGTSVDEIYAAWRHKAVVIGSLLIGFCISTIALCLLFRREMIRRLDSEQALAKAAEELSIIASTDALTGLSNRRALEARFLEEWRRAIRMQTPIGLLMVDADHFKLYNDSQGHQAGDQVLQSIAACIKRNIGRAGDVAARYGGEEFVVVLPGVDIAGALQVSEHIRHDVEALDIPHASNPDWRITVSIGVAVTVPTLNDSGSNLLKKADEALYKAKRAGRNRVQVADNQVPEVSADLKTRFAR